MKLFLTISLLLCSMVSMAHSSSDTAQKYKYFYIEAVRQQDIGNYAAAFELYQHCHEIAPDAAETNFALGTFYTVLGKDSIGESLLKSAAEAAPDNTEYSERLAQTYLLNNNIPAATEVYENLVSKNPDRSDYLEMLLRIYEQQHDYPNMLATLNRMEIQEGASEELTLEKMEIHSQMNNSEGARKELQSLIEAHPFDLNLQVMMGNWLMNNNRKEEALETYLRILKEEPDNAQAQMSLMDYYRADGNNSEADNLLYKMLVNPRTEPNTRVELIRRWVADSEEKGGDSLRVLHVFNKVLALPQATSEVAELKAAYLELKKAHNNSIIAAWREVLSITPENVPARLQIIQALWKDSIDDNVIRECKKAIEYIPNEPILYYYLAMAQHINNRNNEAIKTLKQSTGIITKDTDNKLAADIYGLMGDIYQNMKRMQDAFAAYDTCLTFAPTNVGYLNNFAYALSLDGKDLKKAEKMSYRAISAESNNSTYLDTYAWILYKQKRYDDANAYIDMAIENLKEGDDPDGVIKKHSEKIKKKLKK